MDANRLTEAVAAMPEADREVVSAIADTVDRIVALVADQTALLASLNALDDKRAAEISELRLTVRLLCQIHGLETVGEPLVDLVRRYTGEGSDHSVRAGDCKHVWFRHEAPR